MAESTVTSDSKLTSSDTRRRIWGRWFKTRSHHPRC
ncbi:hypothetical protein NE471_28635, partial [Escherichia coli]